MTQLRADEREALVRSIGQFRRALVCDFLLSALSSLAAADLSLTQVATLLLLDDAGEHTIKALAERLGRSLSAASRLVDQLVAQGLVHRREDEQDRRVKRVAIGERGRALIAELERRRAEAQVAVVATLSAGEQAQVMHAMRLLAEAAARRRRDADPDRGAAAG